MGKGFVNNLHVGKVVFGAFTSLIFSLLLSLVSSNGFVSALDHTASISASETVNVGVSPSGNGVGVSSDSVTVTTTCSAGYNLSIATSGDNKLYKNGDSTNTAFLLIQ